MIAAWAIARTLLASVTVIGAGRPVAGLSSVMVHFFLSEFYWRFRYRLPQMFNSRLLMGGGPTVG